MSRDGTSAKVAVVTGGARGLGRATAVRLAENGYDIAIADITEPTETAIAIRALGVRALPIRCDVSIPTDVAAAIRAVENELGCCDVMVNNAAIYPRRPFEDVDLELWERTLAVNLTSVFLFCKAVVPGMIERGFGRIINLTSNTVGLPVEGVTHYVTSKAAIIGFTRSLASEVGRHGITVNCVAPGATPTEGMLAGHDSPDARKQRMQLFENMAHQQAVKRLANPNDVAGAVAWLASDAASFVSAQTLVVDGGLVRL
ncbi:MAG: SDR family oxidoreductase [Actinomycetota bacterium]|nr:SDR family oxidoreductase [Actinomycetota bacterium]